MSHAPNTIAAIFPDKAEKVSHLKQSNAHFAHLVHQYEEVNALIQRAEAQLDTLADEALEHLKKERLRFTDELAKLLA
jgi:uncharacterized protein YdcH (DUF465 family)